MGNVKRIYVEKKEPFAVKARELKENLKLPEYYRSKGCTGVYPL